MRAPLKKQIRVVMPDPLYQQIKRYSGGNQTRFILDAVTERLRKLEEQRLEEELAECYQQRAQERLEWAERGVSAAQDWLVRTDNE
ncbi:MAG: hypothetical protein FJX76_25885 [Armatimonadetes bacterium]|nr:hypothetical protein [Armatimonadota bacterium]